MTSTNVKLHVKRTKTFVYPKVIFWFLPKLQRLNKITKSVQV